MAKSKLVKANQKIAESVTSGFQKISDTVVDGYTKIEDKFVDQYLTKEGESISEAKERLNKEQAERKAIRAERKVKIQNKKSSKIS